MAPSKFIFLFIFLFFLQPILIDCEFCLPLWCGSVLVEDPFRLTNQSDCCGDPNFNLSCTSRSYRVPDQATINFPFSGDFSVESIDYSIPYILLTDPCIPKRLLEGLNLSNTRFQPLYTRNYMFFNCSSPYNASILYPAIRFDCLSNRNFSIWGIPTMFYDPSSPLSSCLEIAEITIPLRTPSLPIYSIDYILFTWEQPYCVFPPCNYCEGNGSSTRKRKGLSSGTIYALIFIFGAPVILIVLCIIYYNVSHCYDHDQQSNVEILNTEPRLAAITLHGLDGSRIEAYPITFLDENFKLPRPNDNTCSICLSEYQAKETIRTIPDCTHYFHSNCIDEWLKLNAACPVCRNTPDHDSAYLITCSALSSSSRQSL